MTEPAKNSQNIPWGAGIYGFRAAFTLQAKGEGGSKENF